jgi:hypothetical protein
MKFSINNLLTKYNLVLLLFLLFIGFIIIKSFSYKEYMIFPNTNSQQQLNSGLYKRIMKNRDQFISTLRSNRIILPSEPNYNLFGSASNVSIPPDLNAPVCNLYDETNCYMNGLCKWNSKKDICDNLNICSILKKDSCKRNKNCIWNNVGNVCFLK